MKLLNIMSNNFSRLELTSVTLYFSYGTLIAVTYWSKTIIIKNSWGMATGKHLNYIDTDKSIRLEKEEFNKCRIVGINLKTGEKY